jgi:hypothetical protein
MGLNTRNGELSLRAGASSNFEAHGFEADSDGPLNRLQSVSLLGDCFPSASLCNTYLKSEVVFEGKIQGGSGKNMI